MTEEESLTSHPFIKPPPDNHWRNCWNFHQKNELESESTESLLIEIEEKCAEAKVSFLSPDTITFDDFLAEVMKLIEENYVEDPDGTFRFSYEDRHLRWLMLDPRHLDLFIALRENDSGRLVGFLAANPIKLHVSDGLEAKEKEAVLVDFVCVHRERRGQRLCPLLYQVLTWRLSQKNMSHLSMVKTSGDELNYAVSRLRYRHLPLNTPKCIECTFAFPGTRETTAYREIEPNIVEAFQPLEPRHVTSALQLLTAEARKKKLALLFRDEVHLAHLLLPQPDIVATLVKEAEAGSDEVSDLISIFFVPHRICLPGNPLDGHFLRVAYNFYSAVTTLTSTDMLKVAAVIARDRYDVDCLNILPVGTVSSNDCLAVKACQGTGELKYYITRNLGIHGLLQGEEIFLFPGV